LFPDRGRDIGPRLTKVFSREPFSNGVGPVATSCARPTSRGGPSDPSSSDLLHIEFENTGNHRDRPRPPSTGIHRKADRFCALDKQGPAEAALILHDPPAAAIPSDKERRRLSRFSR
jgi:hypothetical protein